MRASGGSGLNDKYRRKAGVQGCHESMAAREQESLDVEKMGRKERVSREVGSEETDSCSGLVKEGRAGSKEVRQRNERTEREAEATTQGCMKRRREDEWVAQTAEETEETVDSVETVEDS